MTPEMVAPRRLLVCKVAVTEILDLRGEASLERVGLSIDSLMSEIGDDSVMSGVGRVAHQLGLHGIIAPSATGVGETLALFEQHLPADELPELIDSEVWDVLPADPRRLRLLKGEEGVM
jgi:hypothetical protein